jgi:hypothetical protein
MKSIPLTRTEVAPVRQPYRGKLGAMAIAAALGVLSTLETRVAPAQEQPKPKPERVACESPPPPGNLREIRCPITMHRSIQRFHFKVNFSGGHDDTSASIVPRMNDGPFTCDKDSKLSLFGEDGDVSLECKFTIKAAVGSEHHFGVAVKWNHAEYTDFQLLTE